MASASAITNKVPSDWNRLIRGDNGMAGSLVAPCTDGGTVAHSSDTTAGLAEDLHEIHTPAGVLRYYDIGDGPPLLFLHGSGPGVTGQRNFRGMLPTFAQAFRCLMLEFPGFGVSPDLGGHPMIAAHGAAWHRSSTCSRSTASTSSATRWVAVSESTWPYITQTGWAPGHHRRHRHQSVQSRPQRGHPAAAGVHRGPHPAASGRLAEFAWCTTRRWSPTS